MNYRMDMATADELAAEDPFGGNGVFLPMSATAEDILDALDGAFGSVPSVAWPMRGAWVRTDGTAESAGALLARWAGR